MNIYKDDKDINILYEDTDTCKNWLAYTDYRDDIFEYLKTLKTFYLRNGYPYSSQAEKSLHQIIVDYWYSEEERKTLYGQGFVIDHLDNNPFNARITNLHFLDRNLNISKGHDYDIAVTVIREKAGPQIYKNFATGNYQITVTFSNPTDLHFGDKTIPITDLYFQYQQDFREVIYDGSQMINEIKKGKPLLLNKLRFATFKYKEASLIKIREGEEESFVFERDGEIFLIQDSRKVIRHSVPPDFELDK